MPKNTNYGQTKRAAKRRSSGGMAQHRLAWLRAMNLSAWLYEYNHKEMREADEAAAAAEQDDREIEDSPVDQVDPDYTPTLAADTDPELATVYLNLRVGDNSVNLNLTILTVPELIALKGMLDLAFLRAVPAARARDRKAKQDAQAGTGFSSRVYRTLPEFVIRRRVRNGHAEGVRLGPQDVLEGRWRPENLFPGLPGDVVRLDEREPGKSEPQDG